MMISKEEHEQAADTLIAAVEEGGSTAERIEALLLSMVRPLGEPHSPNVAMLLFGADSIHTQALLTLFGGWKQHHAPRALERWYAGRDC